MLFNFYAPIPFLLVVFGMGFMVPEHHTSKGIWSTRVICFNPFLESWDNRILKGGGW